MSAGTKKTVRLKDIADIQAGQGAPQGRESYSSEGTPFVKAGNISELINGASEDEIQKVSEEIAKKYKLRLFPKGTILFAKSGMSCMKGYVYVLKKPSYVVNHLACVIPNGIDARYLKYYFEYDKPNRLVKDESYPSISLADIGEMKILIDSEAQQRRIAANLDRISAAIALRRRQAELLDELVRSRFVEMFGDAVSNPKGWEKRALSELGYCKNGMNFHAGDSGVNIKCLGVGDFRDRTVIDSTDELTIISLKEIPAEESLLRDGDIVFVRSNGNKELVGRCVIVYPKDTITTYSGFCIRFRLNDFGVDTLYLLHMLKSQSMRRKMTGRGANIQNLTQQTLSALQVPLPPLRLQNEFAGFVAAADRARSRIGQSEERLRTLKDALMQRYFS